LYSNIIEAEPGKFDWRFSKPAILQSVTEGRSKDRWTEWESLTMPTLLVRGKNSDELDAETYARMLSRQRHARGVEIERAGHWVHSDQPKLFSEALQTFLECETK
jgi:pimeloyl-ACP methyl ester carboxylesterase